MMMAFGPYRFTIGTAAYQQLQKTINYRWQAQDRINNNPALQFVGVGEEQIDLEGTIYPHFKGGFNQINNMRNMANLAAPMFLIDGFGRILGKWVIMQIEETNEVFSSNGIPRKINFRISIAKYGDD